MPFGEVVGYGWPRAIVHIDGDAFFASCEQAIHPELKGKPVITGKERGIVSAASYEAKRLGVKRAMTLSDAKKICPQAIILPSDYETYSIFSKRMYDIMRRYTALVEEYSIDEAFADITGLRRPLNASYEEISRRMKNDIENELGISVSLGVSLSKVLAKIGSKYRKPSGFVPIPGRQIKEILPTVDIDVVWGIGPQTTAYLNKLKIFTAWDFAKLPLEYVEKIVTKPHQEIWHELNGRSVYPIVTDLKTEYASISKTRTFTPPSTDKEFIYSQLVRNLEGACLKARRYDQVAKQIMIFVKTQEFNYYGLAAKLNRPSSVPNEMLGVVRQLFERCFKANTPFRASGVTLVDLHSSDSVQRSLFEPPLKLEKLTQLYEFVDQANSKYGKSTVHLFSSQTARQTDQHLGARGDLATRKTNLFKGETKRQRLGLPVLNIKLG